MKLQRRVFAASRSPSRWRWLRALARLPRVPLLFLLWLYKRGISPLLPGACRYHPTCSEYATEAVQRYGAVRGSWLAVRRVVRCQPLGKGGFDPVP